MCASPRSRRRGLAWELATLGKCFTGPALEMYERLMMYTHAHRISLEFLPRLIAMYAKHLQYHSRALLLKPRCASESPGGLVKSDHWAPPPEY